MKKGIKLEQGFDIPWSGSLGDSMETENGGKQHILIVEDDSILAVGLCRALRGEKIETVNCGTIKEASGLLRERQKISGHSGQYKEQQESGKLSVDCQQSAVQYALVLLDVNLPDGNGFDFLQEIKREYNTAVILLTANDMEMDIVTGLELGADDYITKPFSLAVLRARVATQLRRVREQAEAAKHMQQEQEIVIDDYRFDFNRMEYYHGNTQVELSKTEQKLLRILVENRGILLTREALLDRIWSTEAVFVDENALSVTVKRLRDKLGAQERIKTVYGVGYRFE